MRGRPGTTRPPTRTTFDAGIGIVIGAGTDVAVEAGHVELVRSDPRDNPRML
jgi:cation transport ATPase